jgi:hypothetical protein
MRRSRDTNSRQAEDCSGGSQFRLQHRNLLSNGG